MCRRKNGSVKSSPEEEVVSPNPLLKYCKPVRLYKLLQRRSQHNPSFLSRNYDCRIEAKRERKSRTSGLAAVFNSKAGTVVFNYKDCNNTIQKTEVTENFSCPFCYMRCGNFKGLQCHLNATHDLFAYAFVVSEESKTVNLSILVDEFGWELEADHEDPHKPYYMCSKARKLRQSRGRNSARRLNARFLPMDSNDAESRIPPLNNGNRGLGYPEARDAAESLGVASNTTPAARTHSSQESDARSRRPGKAEAHPNKMRKLSAERPEARMRSQLFLLKRQFYHSHRVQPMSLEQVMSDRDSEDEVDEDVADLEDRLMLDDFEDISKDDKHFMHLWNSFVKKQRIRADGHIPWACEAFTKLYKKEFLNYSTLYWCWRLHMFKLWKHGLLDACTINKCNSHIQSGYGDKDAKDGKNK